MVACAAAICRAIVVSDGDDVTDEAWTTARGGSGVSDDVSSESAKQARRSEKETREVTESRREKRREEELTEEGNINEGYREIKR